MLLKYIIKNGDYMKDLKQINAMIEKETKGRISVLKYTGSDSSVVIRCNICNTTKTRKSFRKSDVIRSVCYNCKQKKDFAEKEEKYKKSLKNTEYELLDHYKGAHKKLRFQHKKCGLVFEQIPYKPSKLSCTKCVNGKPKIEIAQEDLDRKYNGDYTIINFTNREKLTVEHKCEATKKTKMQTMLQQKNKCHCKGGTKRRNKQELVKELISIFGDEYEVIGEININSTILVKHKNCGKVRKGNVHYFLRGYGCHECDMERRFPNRIKHNADFTQRLNREFDGEDYSIVSDYVNMFKHVILKHKICNNTFKVTPINFFNSKTRCPYCRGTISKGELKIEKALLKREVQFQYQYYLDDCVNPKTNKKLPFDFALFKEDKLVALIEYDGQQHFIPVPHFGGEEKLRLQQSLDKIKDDYCKKKQIKLFRINYKKFNKIDQEIELILKNTTI